MKIYNNRTNTSCTYDAFEQAGLPVFDKMLYGITVDETVSLLEKHGYEFLSGECVRVELPEDEGFFVFFDNGDKSNHIEYHVNSVGLLDGSKKICAVALKKIK